MHWQGLIRKDFPAFLSKYNLDFKVSFQGLAYYSMGFVE